MEIIQMPVGDYQTNCFLVWQEGREDCILIDPGYLPEEILGVVRQQGKTVAAILLTHGHFDHVGGVKKIAKETGCAVYLREEENNLPPFMTAGALYSTDSYAETITVAGLTFTVLHTPGHTPGSVCLICEDTIFAGDTLFAGSCGRTDFPGSNPGDMKKSLQKLYALPGDYRVFSGHGEDTTLQHEREHNPYMKGAL
jgi:glyoxylase-like metal-dependent hydrolase (beta-lactamase superfamily II)